MEEFPEPPDRSIFASMRFRHGFVLREAVFLERELEKYGYKLHIIDMRAGGDIDEKVFSTIEHCNIFLVFGTRDYGENTGNSASTYRESKYAENKGKKIILLRMIDYDQEFTHWWARVLFGMNWWSNLWVEGESMPPSLLDDILHEVNPDLHSAGDQEDRRLHSPGGPLLHSPGSQEDRVEITHHGGPSYKVLGCIACLMAVMMYSWIPTKGVVKAGNELQTNGCSHAASPYSKVGNTDVWACSGSRKGRGIRGRGEKLCGSTHRKCNEDDLRKLVLDSLKGNHDICNLKNMMVQSEMVGRKGETWLCCPISCF